MIFILIYNDSIAARRFCLETLMLTRLSFRFLLAATLSLAAGFASAQSAEDNENVYAREPLNEGRAQHARVVLGLYGPAIAFYDSVGANPRKRLTRSDLGELFASVAFSSLGCKTGDSACEGKARQAGVKSASRVVNSKDIGGAIQHELASVYNVDG